MSARFSKPFQLRFTLFFSALKVNWKIIGKEMSCKVGVVTVLLRTD